VRARREAGCRGWRARSADLEPGASGGAMATRGIGHV
jgi:hypothetical protein